MMALETPPKITEKKTEKVNHSKVFFIEFKAATKL